MRDRAGVSMVGSEIEKAVGLTDRSECALVHLGAVERRVGRDDDEEVPAPAPHQREHSLLRIKTVAGARTAR